MPLYMVFDVESIGLHGEAFAVAWVVVDRDGHEIEHGVAACPPETARGSDEDRAWVAENVPPIAVNAPTPALMRETFWEHWERIRATWGGVEVFADCAWPVEARFFAACVDDAPERKFSGPYPLHDVASVRLAAGHDPRETTIRLEGEGPIHHPLGDARQSARLLLEALPNIKAATLATP